MAHLELDISKWAKQQFGDCQLGDKRRTQRIVKLAEQVAKHPDGSTPEQTSQWADCKAAYRLFDADDVSFDAICQPHWRLTRSQCEGTWLLIGDTTEIDFGVHRETTGLGPTGNGGGLGFLLHSSLAVNAETDEIAGLAGADLFHRKPRPKQETSTQKKNRPRESEVWGRVIDAVGSAPEATRFIHLFDAGADNYEVFCHLQLQRCGWVIRSGQKHRVVRDLKGNRGSVLETVQQQAVAGTYELKLRSRKNRPTRTATLDVRFVAVKVPRPKQRTPFMKECGIEDVPMWIVEVCEVDAPKGVTPLHWVLLTSEPVRSFKAAWEIIEWYEKRWVIEDYHKCLKTGCRIESRQYATSDRLQRVTGLLSVVAVRLLQLKFLARSNPDCRAKRVVPEVWMKMLKALRPKSRQTTVSEFFRSLAMLGGFLGRKHDGEPGWITIWRGFQKLNIAIQGAQAMNNKKCG